MKKFLCTILIGGLLTFALTGCGNDNPEGEMVKREESSISQRQEKGVTTGSSYVENRTFPTLSELQKSVKEEMGEHYWPETSLSEKELEEKTGITPDMYVEFLAETPVMDSDIDTMIIIHAKEEYVGAIEQALEAYRSRIIEENEDYPQNSGKAQASRMETIENYICFVQLGADTTVVADKGEDEIIAYCQEENERALYVLEKEILE